MDEVQRAYVIAKEGPKAFWMATAAAIAHPRTRTAGLRMASYGIRVSWNVARASAGAALGTPLVKGGTTTIGGAATGVAAGYAIGATVGTGISYALFGEEGAKTAVDLYTGGVSPGQYISTVSSAIRKIL